MLPVRSGAELTEVQDASQEPIRYAPVLPENKWRPIGKGLLIGAGLLLWLVFVWPTPFEMVHQGHVLYRVNRLSGFREVSTPTGWASEAALIAEKERKDKEAAEDAARRQRNVEEALQAHEKERQEAKERLDRELESQRQEEAEAERSNYEALHTAKSFPKLKLGTASDVRGDCICRFDDGDHGDGIDSAAVIKVTLSPYAGHVEGFLGRSESYTTFGTVKLLDDAGLVVAQEDCSVSDVQHAVGEKGKPDAAQLDLRIRLSSAEFRRVRNWTFGWRW